MLCYNRLLKQYIAQSLDGCGKIDVRTFHSWCWSNGVDWKAFKSDEETGRTLLAKMQGPNSVRKKYDCILVDEAQLMPRDWLRCVTLALHEQDPQKASLFVVADGAQALRKMIPYTWKDAGIEVPGRRSSVRDINYRNTYEILLAARSLYQNRSLLEGPSDPAPPDPEKCVRNGPEPIIWRLDNRISEVEFAAIKIQEWLVGGFPLNGTIVKPRPEDIAIIYPHCPGQTAIRETAARLQTKLGKIPVVVLSGDNSQSLSHPGVRFLTMQKATGLQFRFTILIWTDLLPSNFTDNDDAALLYMAMTRAEDVLVILHSLPSKFMKRIKTALASV